jgi:hypothetical protein
MQHRTSDATGHNLFIMGIILSSADMTAMKTSENSIVILRVT